MTFIDDVIAIYKREGNKNLYDCNNKTALQIVEDYKIHIIEDINSYSNYSIYIFKETISNELMNELKEITNSEISPNVYINNNKILLDLNTLI
jgi:hypothetical protein